MISISIENEDVKPFMSKLLKDDNFDFFEVRNIEVLLHYKLEINGVYIKEDIEEDIKKNYCLWGELKNILFYIIKNNKKPQSIKIILSYPENNLSSIHDNAKAIFLNIYFSNNKVTCTTGTAQKIFTYDKSLELLWDEYITNFISTLNL